MCVPHTLSAFASAARTVDPTDFNYENRYGHNGVVVAIDVTSITATPSITVTIYDVDPATGKERTLLVSAAITTVSTVFLKVFPGATAAANLAANDVIGRNLRIAVAHGDTDSITYAVGVTLVEV